MQFRVKIQKVPQLHGQSARYWSKPQQIQTLIKMRSQSKSKEVQNLMDRIVTLNRFVSRLMDKSSSFFYVLKGGKKFEWNNKYEQAFQSLKKSFRESTSNS